MAAVVGHFWEALLFKGRNGGTPIKKLSFFGYFINKELIDKLGDSFRISREVARGPKDRPQ